MDDAGESFMTRVWALAAIIAIVRFLNLLFVEKFLQYMKLSPLDSLIA